MSDTPKTDKSSWFALNAPYSEDDEDVVEVVNAEVARTTERTLRSLLFRATELLPPGKWYEDGAPADDAAKLREDIADV